MSRMIGTLLLSQALSRADATDRGGANLYFPELTTLRLGSAV
jgi:hypothetical protein